MTKSQKFETYIAENLDSIYRFAYTFTKNQSDAEDVVNESVVKALQSLHLLRNTAFMGTWFYRIIVNTSLTALKKQNRVVYLDPAQVEEEVVCDNFSDMDFDQLIQRLDPKYKSIIVLHFFEDKTLKEIAAILDENINTVKTRMYKALKLLRIEMEESV